MRGWPGPSPISWTVNAVSSVGQAGNRAWFSNFSPAVSLSAPGVDTDRTDGNGDLDSVSIDEIFIRVVP